MLTKQRLSDTIQRVNLKIFKSPKNNCSTSSEKKLNESKKDSVQAQRAVDLACIRGYDLKLL